MGFFFSFSLLLLPPMASCDARATTNGTTGDDERRNNNNNKEKGKTKIYFLKPYWLCVGVCVCVCSVCDLLHCSFPQRVPYDTQTTRRRKAYARNCRSLAIIILFYFIFCYFLSRYRSFSRIWRFLFFFLFFPSQLVRLLSPLPLRLHSRRTNEYKAEKRDEHETKPLLVIACTI